MKLDRLFFCAAVLAATAGCGGDDDPNNGWTCVGGCPSEGVTTVDNDTRARLLGTAIGEAATAKVPSGSFANQLVDGLAGTATFSGASSHTESDCGTDCLRRTTNTNVTVVFSGYHVKVGTDDVTLSGTATITNNQWSQQSGLAYSSGGALRVQSTRLVARHAITQSNGQVWGEADTVAVSISSNGSWSGSVQGANGVTYSF